MPEQQKSSRKIPGYKLHKPSGQARVIIEGKHIYLGEFGSQESKEKYARLIADKISQKPKLKNLQFQNTGIASDLSIDEIVVRYWVHAKSYYIKPDGSPSKELACMRDAIKNLRELYGTLPTSEFGPLCLKGLREHMISAHNLSRGVINNRINRIKRIFKYAVSEELISPVIYEGLRSIGGLRKGRTNARETKPVTPVPDEVIAQTIPYVSPPVAAMIQIQRLTGMRPCEVTLMRKSDIKCEGEVWLFTPREHKNDWRGHQRVIPLGPKAQEIMAPYLSVADEEFLFSPKQAEELRNQHRRIERNSPVYGIQLDRIKKTDPQRAKRDRYDTDSYRRAITYGINKANKTRKKEGLELIPHWFPLQIRHTRATEINEAYGIEAAAVSLGHAHAEVTKVYSERNLKLAKIVAKNHG